MTNNLARRIYEHKNKMNKGFTAKYNVDKLVYFKKVENEMSAKKLEKQIKSWLRKRKIILIESQNPNWDDLSSNWMDSLLGKTRISVKGYLGDSSSSKIRAPQNKRMEIP